jgi:Recombinase
VINPRARDALTAAKARGTLDNPQLAAAQQKGHMAMRRAAARRDVKILPVIIEIKQAGAVTLCQIASQLTARNIKSARGGRWTAKTVQNLIERTPGAA